MRGVWKNRIIKSRNHASKNAHNVSVSTANAMEKYKTLAAQKNTAQRAAFLPASLSADK